MQYDRTKAAMAFQRGLKALKHDPLFDDLKSGELDEEQVAWIVEQYATATSTPMDVPLSTVADRMIALGILFNQMIPVEDADK